MIALEPYHAAELVPAKSGQQAFFGQDRADSLGNLAQHRVSGAVSVDIVDRLEVVEIDHQERDRIVTILAGGDQAVGLLVEAAAVEAAGQRIGFGQYARMFFCGTAFLDFDPQLAIAAPAENDQRDVEQQGVGQHRIGARDPFELGAHDLGQDGAAGAKEHDDGGRGDAERDEIAIGLGFAVDGLCFSSRQRLTPLKHDRGASRLSFIFC